MIREDAVDSLRSLRHMEAYSDPCQTSRRECFEKIFSLAIFEKSSSLDVWQNSKYALG